MTLREDLQGWIPLRLLGSPFPEAVEWLWAGAHPMESTFYDLWLSNLLKIPFNALFRRRTSLKELQQFAEEAPTLPLHGLIFHTSRCGSTLVANTLAALPQNQVISEPYLLERVVLQRFGAPNLPDDLRLIWLRALVNALGQPHTPQKQHLFIKLDALAVLRLDLFRQAFPDTAWTFLCRDPLEVFVSQQRETAVGFLPGYLDPELLGESLETLFMSPLETYQAHLLKSLYAAPLNLTNLEHGLLLNYTQLPQAMWGVLAPHFGVSLTPTEQVAMQTAARYDAKSAPGKIFTSDSQQKQAQANPNVRDLMQQHLLPVYTQLEAQRAAHYPPRSILSLTPHEEIV